jgi:electron transfer flavoprotein alpha subunit
MDFVVLVKAVPPLDDLRYDPDRRTVVREGTELFLNPFDQRALRVALQLRKDGETVTVISMGPLAAREPLRDAKAMGADRVILLSDARLAGSDTLATARTLTAALTGIGRDLVLTGSWTTDSETGQVGPEVAALLDVPVFTGARGMGREVDGPGIVVTVDTNTGWASYAARTPVVVSVGEKIIKPGKVSPEERGAVAVSDIEVWDLARLSLDPGTVGLDGSPTIVTSVGEDAPHRSPVIVADGTPAEQVARAVELLRPLLAGPRRSSPTFDPLPGPGADDHEVLVLVTDGAGHLAPRAPALLSEVRRSLPGFWPSAVWIGDLPDEASTGRLARAGAVAAYEIRLPSVPTDSGSVALAFGRVLDRRESCAAGLFLSDPFGREVAARVAASRALGLTGDAVGVSVRSDSTLVWSKPSFGGRTLAGIVSRTRPSLATVRPGVWAEGDSGTGATPLDWTRIDPPALPDPILPFDTGEEVPAETPTLDERDVVIAVGMGIGGPRGLDTLAPTLERWDASLGATRKVVDAGWVPRQFQIGLTGRAPPPRLGVLLGVGGSANHLVGWKRAHALLAVNSDPAAAVFREVDVGIVAKVEDVVPLLTEALAPLVRR